jgi:hypothetical protein
MGRRFILFHNQCHPQELGVEAVEAFLTDLAIQQQVSASMHQALAALLFRYRYRLKQP